MPEVLIRSKRLHLAHRSHTGRRLHKTHTSYPLLAVLLLMVGVLLTAMTLQVRAADITVTAVANGPAPVQPAVILSPDNNSRFSDSSIPVSGTCPAGYYVKLFRNDIFSGSTLCNDGGTFSITTDLFAGRNDLQARIFNVADEEGPRSGIVTVYYDVPDGPIQPGLPDDGYQPSGRPDAQSPFYLSTEYFFKAAYTGQRITWDFDIFGGSGPYTAYIVWGDGYSDMQQKINGNSFTIEHLYNSLKDQREYFSVTIRVQDTYGRRASLQLVAIMNDPHVIGGALVRPGDVPPITPASVFSGLLKVVWSMYGIVLLMGLCFWLGEIRGESMTRSLYRRKHHA